MRNSCSKASFGGKKDRRGRDSRGCGSSASRPLRPRDADTARAPAQTCFRRETRSIFDNTGETTSRVERPKARLNRVHTVRTVRSCTTQTTGRLGRASKGKEGRTRERTRFRTRHFRSSFGRRWLVFSIFRRNVCERSELVSDWASPLTCVNIISQQATPRRARPANATASSGIDRESQRK